jgi:hypothetical protein
MSTYPYASFVSTTGLPISMGEVLEKLWRTLRSNWKLYLWLGMPVSAMGILFFALYFAALFGSGALPPHPGVQPDFSRVLPWVFGVMLVGGIPNLLVFALYQAAAVFTALKAAGGERTTMREAYAAAWSNAGRYCWLMILQYLCAFGPCLVVFGFFAGVVALVSATVNGGNPGLAFLLIPLVILMYLGGMVYGVWMGLKVAFAFPASVAEGLPAVAALKRSMQLTYKAKGKLFLVLLIVYAISYAAMLVLELGFGLIAAVSVLVFSALHLGQSVGIALAVVAGLIFLAAMMLYCAAIWAAYILGATIVYCDQRLRLDTISTQPEVPLA